jgi:PAS domain S-box-containing protein
MRSGLGLTGFESVPSIDVLEELARLHQGVLLTAPDGRIVWVSSALAPHLDSDGERRFEELFADPATGAELWETLHNEGRLSNRPADIVGRDGEHLHAALTAVRVSCDGEPGPVVALVRSQSDLSGTAEHGGSEAQGDRMRESLRTILDCSPDAAVAVDPSGFVVHANPAVEELLGYTPEGVVDQPISIYLHHRRDVTRIARALHSEKRAELSGVEVLARSGDPVRVSVYASTLRLPDGSEAGAVAYLRRAAPESSRASLERKNAELEHSLRSVSHDLRSPLVALLGFSKLLRDDYSDQLGEKGSRFLQRIEQAGRTMESLVQDLLELSRVGSSDAHKSLVDPSEVLLQLKAELKPRLDENDTRLDWDPDVPLVQCDRTRLYQVLANLVGNALEHMGDVNAPRVVVEFRNLGSHTCITVRDNGRGIDAEHHDRIFEIFQSARTGAEKRRGSGVGLAIVKKIAEAHGGRAWVESELGAGAAFHVTLPCPEQPPE